MLLDVIAPVICVSCGAAGDGELCASCGQRVAVIGEPRCDRCGSPALSPMRTCAACVRLKGFDRARSLVVYAEPARSLTLALKRRGRRGLTTAVGALLADLARSNGLAADVVAFVPAGRRARGPGFDHAELIARAVAGRLGVPSRRLLTRIADGPRQADVRFNERRTNVRGRFAALPSSGAILLVDDVFTTGSTAEACALALRASGAERVDVVTWARTLRRRA